MGNHCTLDFSLMEISVKRPFLFRSILLHRGIESRWNPRRVEPQVHPLSAKVLFFRLASGGSDAKWRQSQNRLQKYCIRDITSYLRKQAYLLGMSYKYLIPFTSQYVDFITAAHRVNIYNIPLHRAEKVLYPL